MSRSPPLSRLVGLVALFALFGLFGPFGLLACSRAAAPSGAGAGQGPDAGCTPTPSAPVKLPSFEADLLFQYLSGDREGQASGLRVHLDGRLDRRQKDGPWQADTPLDAARLARLRATLEAAALRQQPASWRADPPPEDATSWTLQSRDAAGAISLSGLGCRPALVDALFVQVAPLLSPG